MHRRLTITKGGAGQQLRVPRSIPPPRRISQAPFVLLASASILAWLATGCDRGASFQANADLRVDSVTTVGMPEITWEPEPLYVVGASDPTGEVDHPLHLVMDARIRSDSGLVITQRSVQSLLVFDRDGLLRERVGTDGEGPGEFRRVRSAVLLDEDSVLAWDAGLRRLSVFDGSGELSEVISSRQDASPIDVYMVGRETFATVSTPRDTRGFLGRSGLHREERGVEFLDRSGEVVGAIDGIRGMEMYQDEHGVAVPYSYRLYVAGGEDGLFVGDGRGAELIEFAITGESRRVLRLPIERQALPSAQLSTLLQAHVNESYQPDRRASALRTLEAAASASGIDSLPAFMDLLSDHDGHLWVKVSGRAGDEPGRWLVVDPATNEGQWVRGHPGWSVLDAGRGLVAALREDALGTERIGVFGLSR